MKLFYIVLFGLSINVSGASQQEFESPSDSIKQSKECASETPLTNLPDELLLKILDLAENPKASEVCKRIKNINDDPEIMLPRTLALLTEKSSDLFGEEIGGNMINHLSKNLNNNKDKIMSMKEAYITSDSIVWALESLYRNETKENYSPENLDKIFDLIVNKNKIVIEITRSPFKGSTRRNRNALSSLAEQLRDLEAASKEAAAVFFEYKDVYFKSENTHFVITNVLKSLSIKDIRYVGSFLRENKENFVGININRDALIRLIIESDRLLLELFAHHLEYMKSLPGDRSLGYEILSPILQHTHPEKLRISLNIIKTFAEHSRIPKAHFSVMLKHLVDYPMDSLSEMERGIIDYFHDIEFFMSDNLRFFREDFIEILYKEKFTPDQIYAILENINKVFPVKADEDDLVRSLKALKKLSAEEIHKKAGANKAP